MQQLYIKSFRYKFVYLFLAIALGMFLLYVSALPHSAIEESFYPQISDLFDMMNHFLGFLLFDFLLFSALIGLSDRKFTKRVMAIYFIVSVSWGLICESIQLFNETRGFQLIDIIANTAPAFIVFSILKRIINRR